MKSCRLVLIWSSRKLKAKYMQKMQSKVNVKCKVGMNLRLKSAGYENFVAELVDNTNVSKSVLSGNRYLVVNMGPKTLQIKPK